MNARVLPDGGSRDAPRAVRTKWSPRAVLRSAFGVLEALAGRIFPPSLNPVGQLGSIGFLLLWIVVVSGVYVYVFFDTSVTEAFGSVEALTHGQWWLGGFMRSFHRYASDLLVVVTVLHGAREFALDRYRGPRWYSWATGVPALGLLIVSGITGYWLVWDQLAQYVAIATSEFLDALPIFSEPIARNFLTPSSLSDRFFTLLVFLHIAVPLVLLIVLWLHLQRISMPRVNPPRRLAASIVGALFLVSLLHPALSQGPADLAKVPGDVGLDWYFLGLYPLADHWPATSLWIGLAVGSLLLLALPWLPPKRNADIAQIDTEHCNGCGLCVADCPYEAVSLVARTDGRPFLQEAAVDPSHCVGCGICVGSCPYSSPFRRIGDLRTGIDLRDEPLRDLVATAVDTAARLTGRPRILVLACRNGPAVAGAPGVVQLPCVANAPPSLVDFLLGGGHADGVVVAACSGHSGLNRLGAEWNRLRLARERDPRLRARVPRDRLLEVSHGVTETRRFEADLTAFSQRLSAMPLRERSRTRPGESTGPENAA